MAMGLKVENLHGPSFKGFLIYESFQVIPTYSLPTLWYWWNHARLLHPVWLCGWTNPLDKKFTNSFTISLKFVKARSKIRNQGLCQDDSGRIFSGIKLPSKLLYISVLCCLISVQLVQELVFVPVASALTATNRYSTVLASNMLQPEMQPLVSLG